MAALLFLNFVTLYFIVRGHYKSAIGLFFVVLGLSLAMFIYQSNHPIKITL